MILGLRMRSSRLQRDTLLQTKGEKTKWREGRSKKVDRRKGVKEREEEGREEGEMKRRKEGGMEVWRRGRGCSGNSRAFQAIPMLCSLASSMQARETGPLLQPLSCSLSTVSALLCVYRLQQRHQVASLFLTPCFLLAPCTRSPRAPLHLLFPRLSPFPSHSYIVLLRPDFSCLLPRHLSSRNNQSRRPF